MSEKAKRKGNPRRRLWVRLLAIIVILVSVGIVAVNLLSPKQDPEWIVYFNYDDNNQQLMWMVDLHHLDAPLQISQHRVSTRISTTKYYIYYETLHDAPPYLHIRHWIYDIRTQETQEIFPCINSSFGCRQMSLSPDGQWLSYYSSYLLENDHGTYYHFVVYNIETNVETIVASDIGLYSHDIQYSMTQWLDNGQIAFMRDWEHYTLYDPNENMMIHEQFMTFIRDSQVPPFVASNGERYLHISDNLMQIGEEINFTITEQGTQSQDIIDTFTQEYEVSGNFDYYIEDWDSENHTLLIREVWFQYRAFEIGYSLLLVNMSSDEVITLKNISLDAIESAQFNAEGTQILISGRVNYTSERYISLYDLETDEETILPISGFSPRWVQ